MQDAPHDPSNRMRDCMQQAAYHAIQQFDALLTQAVKAKTETAAQMRYLLRQDYDWQGGAFSVKSAIDELEDDAVIYRAIAEQSNSVDEIFDALHAVAQAHIDILTFSSNNYPAARLRRDQFVRFADDVAKALHEGGFLAEDDDRFAQLVNGYDMSMNGYALLRERVHEYSNQQYASILECAAALARNEDATRDEEAQGEASALHMVQLYQDITRDYGIGAANGGLVPPAYLYLADMAQSIAVRRAREEMLHEPSREALEPRVAAHREQLLQRMMAIPHDASQMWHFGKIEDFLLDEQAATFKQPRDFRDQLVKSMDTALDIMKKALPRLHKEARPFLASTEKAIGHRNLVNEGIDANREEALERLASGWGRSMFAELGDSATMEDVVVAFEQDADHVLKSCITSMHHPAEILAHRAYAEALGKELAQAYRAEGLPTAELREQFTTIVEKYEHAYASNVEASRWCMVQTDHAYANFGELALAMTKAQLGKSYPELTHEDMDKIPQIAAQYFVGAAKDRHLPDAWCGEPFMPLFYRRALDHVAREQHKENRLGDAHYFADRLVDAEERESIRTAMQQQVQQALRLQATDRVVPLLEKTIAMFSPEEPHINGWPAEKAEDPKQQPPYIDCRTLRSAMEFYERAAHQGVH